jgi:DedD protein
VKERLTGAIILVALIVLLVPELLSGPIRSAPRTVAMASSVEEPPLRSYTIHLADDARSRVAAPPTTQPAQPAPLTDGTPVGASAATGGASPATAAPSAVAPRAATQSSPATSAAPAIQTPAQNSSPSPPTAAPVTTGAGTAVPPGGAAAGASGLFMVQLGSFASRTNADRLARQVRGQGFAVSVSQGSSGRHLYRVWVGPAHDHAAATRLAQQLRSAGHSGSIVPKS